MHADEEDYLAILERLGLECLGAIKVTREDFLREAHNIGLGSKIAMDRLDALSENFAGALDEAIEEVSGMGLTGVDELQEKIGQWQRQILNNLR